MAHETSAFQRLDTVLIDIFPLVAFGAVIHFHAVPRILFKTGNIVAPDVPADAGDPVGLVRFKSFRFTDMPMAGDTVHFSHFDMRDMGEKHTIGLPGVDQPRHFPIFFNVLRVKLFLLRAFSQNLIMTVDALGQLWNPGIGPVVTEKMAAFTAVIHQFVVQGMIELDGLLL